MIYISGSGSIDKDRLARYSAGIAAYLRENNIRNAAVIAGKSPLVFAAIKACLMAQVCYIPVDENLPAERRDIITKDADVVLCDGKCSGAVDIRTIAEQGSSFTPPAENKSLPAYRIYTSGTTGKPKGIEVSRGNVENFLKWFCAIPAIAETKPRSVLNTARFSFDLSVADIYYSLYTGARLTVIERGLMSDFARLFARMRESGAELAVMTPSFAELCLCDRAFSQELMPSLRVVFFCGEVLKPATAEKLFDRFPRLRIVNAYGPSETCCAVTAAEITREMTGRTLPIGDMSHTAGRIDFSESGEIVISGESVARYVGGADGFGEYGGGRCFFTGDGGSIRGGMLYFGGRLDRQVKIMGCRVEPEDIENNLLKTGLVSRAAVTAEELRGRTVLCARVTAGAGITPAEIRAALAGLVPEYMIPRKIILAEDIPLNENGKTKR